MQRQLMEREAKPESSLPGLRTREVKPDPRSDTPAPARAKAAPAPAPTPADDAPAKRKPGRPRKVVA